MISAVVARSCSGVRSYAVATSRKPVITPSDGSCGVECVLKYRGASASRTTTKSVNVPPTSMPMLNMPLSPHRVSWLQYRLTSLCIMASSYHTSQPQIIQELRCWTDARHEQMCRVRERPRISTPRARYEKGG